MSRLASILTIPLFLTPWLSGCRAVGYYHARYSNPIEGASRFAVAPFLVPGEMSLDEGIELTEILASELVQFPGVDEVIRSERVAAVMRERRLGLEKSGDLASLLKALDADAILLVEIKEFDRFYKPSVDFAARLFLGDSPLEPRDGVIELTRVGAARPVHALGRGNVVEVEAVYDSAQNEVYDQAWCYALGRHNRDDAVGGTERLLRVSNLYFRFASDRLITDVFREYARRLEEVQRIKA